MIESSVAITAGGILSLFSEYADLDGNLLISNDPYSGLKLNTKAKVIIPEIEGIGVRTLETEGT